MKICEMTELIGKCADLVIRNYNRRVISGDYGSLFKVYKSHSMQKEYAERNIISEMHENGGYGYCIVGANIMTFSCAYRCGEWLVYHTRDKVYKIKYPA